MWYRTIGVMVTLTLSILVAPLVAEAPRVSNIARVGVLVLNVCSNPIAQAFEHRLRELGYVEGHNLVLECRTAEGQAERLPALAAELVRLPVDVLVAPGPEALLHAARQATSTMPIVMVAVDYDPIARGYVAGLARPGGNITGVFVRQPELATKRLELLKEALPQARRVAVLWDAFSAAQLREVEAAARVLEVELQPLELRQPPYDYGQAMSSAIAGRAQALLVLLSPLFFRDRARINDLVAHARLPASFGIREHVEGGGLMSYGVNLPDMFRRAADYVDKILKGAKPADLPVEQPTKFELIINLKTAQALGITIPPTLLFLADEVLK